MTETLHRPGNAKAEARALRLKQAKTGAQDVESFSEPSGPSILDRDFIEQQLASVEKISLDSADDPVSDSEAPLPRMTPAHIEAMQQFAVESRVSPEDAYDEAVNDNKKIDNQALRALRKEDYSEYVKTVVALAEQELAGGLDGRKNQNRLIRESLQDTAEKNLAAASKTTKALGKAAILNGSALAVGLAKKGWKPVNNKIYEVQSTRAHKKHMKGLHKEALVENKLRDRNERRSARRERFESLRESALSPARKLGRFALDAHLVGLETVNPERAAEIRTSRDSQRAEAVRAQTEAALSPYAIEGQSDIVQFLMNNEALKPSQVVTSEHGNGFLSDTFADASDADTKYAFYFAPKEKQLFPYLMKQAKSGVWQRELRGNTTDIYDKTDEEMIVQAANLLDTSKSDVTRALDRDQMQALRDVLIYSMKRPEAKAHPVSEYAKKREAIIKAKKNGTYRASGSKKVRDGDDVVYKITNL